MKPFSSNKTYFHEKQYCDFFLNTLQIFIQATMLYSLIKKEIVFVRKTLQGESNFVKLLIHLPKY